MLVEKNYNFVNKSTCSYVSVDIHYCTHEGNERPTQFEDFCEAFLNVKAVSKEFTKEDRVVMVLAVPTVNRLNPYNYFVEKIIKLVEEIELKGNLHCPISIKIWTQGELEI